MIKAFFQALIIYIFVRLLILLHILTYSELKEFALFCTALVILFVLSRYSILLRDKLYSKS